VARKAPVTHAKTWYYEDGLKAAPRVLRERPAGVFCANDRLAAALQDTLGKEAKCLHPAIVGYDDAPIAQVRGLTTIAIPWEEIAAGAAALALARIKGDTKPSRFAEERSHTPGHLPFLSFSASRRSPSGPPQAEEKSGGKGPVPFFPSGFVPPQK
jgi:DNA-binding LacI/PurR family transcriptional regulator